MKGQLYTGGEENQDLVTTWYSVLTSDKSVVKQHEADEDAIKDSEGYKKPVERVLHLLAGKDDDGEDIANQAKHPDR